MSCTGMHPATFPLVAFNRLPYWSMEIRALPMIPTTPCQVSDLRYHLGGGRGGPARSLDFG